MAEQRDVKVFISWSGDLSKAVAAALREWLPLLFDRVEPWASDTDIAAGQRGLPQIEAELAGAQFGVVVVTAANQNAPWLNFEAGALSKTVPGAEVEHRVVPLLVDLSSPTEVTGPLYQFQGKMADREGLLDLLRSLGAVAGIGEAVVAERLDAYWPRLEEKIAAARAKDTAVGKGKPKGSRREPADVMDEILLHVRKLRSDTEALADQPVTRVRTSEAAMRRAREIARAATPFDDLDDEQRLRMGAREAIENDSLRLVIQDLAHRHGFLVRSLSIGADRVRVIVSPRDEDTGDDADKKFRESLRVLLPPAMRVQIAVASD